LSTSSFHILLIHCADEKGLISKISTTVFNLGLNIIVMKEFVDSETNFFFMRCELSGELDIQSLYQDLYQQLPLKARITINPKKKKDIVVLATKEFHCLSDLVTRHHFDEVNANIKAIVSNHDFLEPYVKKFDIPFHYIGHENKSKADFEKQVYEITKSYRPDYLVLAKFMRILSEDFVSAFENRIVNIHHSFLPAFIGANPYKQAFERGVKLIGATAHFVNNNLDEGPIISQKVLQVDHTFSVKNMVQAGHEVERAVLFEALNLILEDRVFVTGNKTIIFA